MYYGLSQFVGPSIENQVSYIAFVFKKPAYQRLIP